MIPNHNNLKKPSDSLPSMIQTEKGTKRKAEQNEAAKKAKIESAAEEAVRKIQAACRAYLRREEYHLLLGKKYIDNNKVKDLTPAGIGRTETYSAHTLGIVLKKSGSKCDERLEKMELARKICTENGYTNLVIPRAQKYGDFLIESKVLFNGHCAAQIALYMENLALFEKAILEFTDFLCQTSLEDIWSYCASPFEALIYRAGIKPGKLPRFDNVPLFIRDGEGKLGLIDLETLTKEPPSTSDAYKKRCMDLIAFFPHHHELITKTVKKYDPEFETYAEELNTHQKARAAAYDILYGSHLRSFEKKGVTLKNPLHRLTVSESDSKEKVIDELRTRFSNFLKNFSGKAYRDEAEKYIAAIEKELCPLLHFCADFLYSKVKDQIGDMQPLSSNAELLSKRCLKLQLWEMAPLIGDILDRCKMPRTEVWKGITQELVLEPLLKYFEHSGEIASCCLHSAGFCSSVLIQY